MSNLDALPDFARTNALKLANIQSSGNPEWEDRIEPATSEEANLVTSIAWAVNNEVLHYPLLDIDFPAALLPSSTKDHYHLYLGKAVSWDVYLKLLEALYAAGIIEKGIYDNAVKRGFTSLRMPHVKKGDEKLNHPFKSEKQQQIEEISKQVNELNAKLNELLYGDKNGPGW